MLSPFDRDVELFKTAYTVAGFAVVGGVLLLNGAGLHSVAGLLRGLGGLALIVAAVWGFRKYWRGDWDDFLLGDLENR